MSLIKETKSFDKTKFDHDSGTVYSFGNDHPLADYNFRKDRFVELQQVLEEAETLAKKFERLKSKIELPPTESDLKSINELCITHGAETALVLQNLLTPTAHIRSVRSRPGSYSSLNALTKFEVLGQVNHNYRFKEWVEVPGGKINIIPYAHRFVVLTNQNEFSATQIAPALIISFPDNEISLEFETNEGADAAKAKAEELVFGKLAIDKPTILEEPK